MEILDLRGRKGLVVGIANEESLAWSAAKHFREAGAELAVTYLNDKAKPFVAPLAESIAAPIVLPCNVSIPGQLEAVFQEIEQRWGRLRSESLEIDLETAGLSRPQRDRAGRPLSIGTLTRMLARLQPLGSKRAGGENSPDPIAGRMACGKVRSKTG